MPEEYEGYVIVTPAGKGSVKEIRLKGRGKVVVCLRGIYTTANEAKKAIDLYKESRSAPDGKAKSADRG